MPNIRNSGKGRNSLFMEDYASTVQDMDIGKIYATAEDALIAKQDITQVFVTRKSKLISQGLQGTQNNPRQLKRRHCMPLFH